MQRVRREGSLREEQEGGESEPTWNECEEERGEEQSEEEGERGAGGGRVRRSSRGHAECSDSIDTAHREQSKRAAEGCGGLKMYNDLVTRSENP
jgi:hypothetical protein